MSTKQYKGQMKQYFRREFTKYDNDKFQIYMYIFFVMKKKIAKNMRILSNTFSYNKPFWDRYRFLRVNHKHPRSTISYLVDWWLETHKNFYASLKYSKFYFSRLIFLYLMYKYHSLMLTHFLQQIFLFYKSKKPLKIRTALFLGLKARYLWDGMR